MAKYLVRLESGYRHESEAAQSAGIHIKLFGTVADSEEYQIGMVYYAENSPPSARWITGTSYFTIESKYYLGDIYRISIANRMTKFDNYPNPDLYVDNIFITNPDPENQDKKSNVVSRFIIREWINEKNRTYTYSVDSGLSLDVVNHMTEKMVYGTEFSVEPNDVRSMEIQDESESSISETVTSVHTQKETHKANIHIKPSVLDIFSEGNYEKTTIERTEKTETQTEIKHETRSATITNKQNRKRTFKPAYIIRKKYSTLHIGNLWVDNAYAEEHVFAGFMETTKN